MGSRLKKKTQRTAVTRDIQVATAEQGDALNNVESTGEGSAGNLQSYPSRADEKKALSQLNNRLLNYIEKVRTLELENSQLRYQIRGTETEERREREAVTNEYKQKITELRNKLEVATKACNRAELESKKSESKSNELQLKLTKARNDLASTIDESDLLRTQLDCAKKQASDANTRRDQAEDLADGMRKDLETALQQNDVLKAQLEDEAMLRSELQSKYDGLKDDLEVERRDNQARLDEVYKKRTVEITTIGDQLKTDYNTELQNQLKQLRVESDARIRQSRQEVDAKYASTIAELQNDLDASREQYHQARQELKAKISEMDALKRKHNLLKNDLETLQDKLKSMEETLAHKDSQLNAKNERIRELREEIARLSIEYKDLLDIKLQLDEELRTYDVLLKGEEARLNLNSANGTANDSQISSSDPNIGRNRKRPNPLRFLSNLSGLFGGSPNKEKRPRLDVEEEILTSTRNDSHAESFRTESASEGSLIIDEVDSEGGFVSFTNKGNKSLALHGYSLVVRDNEREVTYKFGTKLTLKPGEQITIFSADSGEQQELSGHKLVLKSENWPAGEEYRLAEIFDVNEQLVAKSEMHKEVVEEKPWAFFNWN